MDKLKNRMEGFTLVEMLAVIAIIGILVAVAILQFLNYRKIAFEALIKEDLRNAAAAQESYFATHQAYIGGALTSGNPPGYNRSAPITTTAAVAGNSFTLTAVHLSCAGVTWSYSSVGGAIDGGPCP